MTTDPHFSTMQLWIFMNFEMGIPVLKVIKTRTKETLLLVRLVDRKYILNWKANRNNWVVNTLVHDTYPHDPMLLPLFEGDWPALRNRIKAEDAKLLIGVQNE